MKSKVVIIGAGISGIASALHLLDTNEVVLIEQKKYIGGRICSFKDINSNEIIDNGQHLLSSSYTNFLNIIKILNTESYLDLQKCFFIKFIEKYNDYDIFKNNINFGKLGLLFALFNLKKISINSKIKILKIFLKIRYINKYNDNLKTIEFLKLNYQTEESIKRFWEPFVLAVLNSGIYNSSAKLLIIVLKKMFLSNIDSINLIFPQSSLSELLKTFPIILNEKNGKLFTKTRVNKLLIDNNIVIGVELDDKRILYCDYLITTLQPNELLKILPKNFKVFDYLNRFSYSPIISVYLWFDKSFIFDKFACILNKNIQWIFNRNDIIAEFNKDRSLFRITLTISNAIQLIDRTNDEILRICINELNEIFPDTINIQLIYYRIIKERKATINITPDIEKIRPNTTTNIKNLFIAGDWTNTGLPATIESAAISGIAAAKNII